MTVLEATADAARTGTDAKALEARLHEQLGWFGTEGIQVKGWAPLLVDFPSTLEGYDVLLCWLEGEVVLDWYHRIEHGFPGRRRIPAAAE